MLASGLLRLGELAGWRFRVELGLESLLLVKCAMGGCVLSWFRAREPTLELSLRRPLLRIRVRVRPQLRAQTLGPARRRPRPVRGPLLRTHVLFPLRPREPIPALSQQRLLLPIRGLAPQLPLAHVLQLPGGFVPPLRARTRALFPLRPRELTLEPSLQRLLVRIHGLSQLRLLELNPRLRADGTQPPHAHEIRALRFPLELEQPRGISLLRLLDRADRSQHGLLTPALRDPCDLLRRSRLSLLQLLDPGDRYHHWKMDRTATAKATTKTAVMSLAVVARVAHRRP